MGPILFVKVRAGSSASVEPVGLLLDTTALLEELPPRTKVVDCTRSGSARSASTP